MYVNAGYLKHTQAGCRDHARPLAVSSCGTYRLSAQPDVLPTHWPRGQMDYQLLYVAAGKAHFFFDGREETAGAGSMILYRPGEEPRYACRTAEHPEIFWVHFSGCGVKDILARCRFTSGRHIYCTGTRSEYRWLFQRMTLELPLCKPFY